MENSYQVLHQVYRELAKQRHHFENQLQALQLLFKMHGIKKQARILDAACGTGDTVIGLHSLGYKTIFAVDGSEHQLSQWPQYDYDIPRLQCNWIKLDRYFEKQEPFDFIYFLGHSLPHLPLDKLPQLLNSVFTSLSKNGILAFDIRPWIKLHNGQLMQVGREEGVTRLLGTMEVGNQPHWLFEEVRYKGVIQEVQYQLLAESNNNISHVDELTYYMYHWETAIDLLINAGFRRKDISVLQLPNWPYLVILGKKYT